MSLGSQMTDISVNNQIAHFNTGLYGDPLKNENFKNRALSCFNLAQIRSKAKISCNLDFWWLRKTWTDRQTDKIHPCFISIDAFILEIKT